MDMTTQSTVTQSTVKDVRQQQSGTAPADSPAAPGSFRIRYVPAAIALLAVASLAGAITTTVLLALSMVPYVWPLALTATTVVSLGVLRALAVRRRRQRRVSAARARTAAPTTASATDAGSASDVARPAKEGATRPFDAQGQPGVAPDAAMLPGAGLTAAELRAAALAEAAHPAVPARADGAEASVAMRSTIPQGQWDPIQIPKPTYVGAAKAERAAPEPLTPPAEPKPSSKTPLKAAAVAPVVADAGLSTPKAEKTMSAEGQKINLDDVLQRRRA